MWICGVTAAICSDPCEHPEHSLWWVFCALYTNSVSLHQPCQVKGFPSPFYK